MGDNLTGRVAAGFNAGRDLTAEEQAEAEEAAERAAELAQAVAADRAARAPRGIVAALADVMAEVRGVGKDEFHNSPGAKFKFRGIDAVVNAVGPALRMHGVIVVPELITINQRDVLTSGGKPSRETTVLVRYTFYGPDGSKIECITPGEAMDSSDKGTAKAMSVAFRIALLQALCLPTDDRDPDADAPQREAPAPTLAPDVQLRADLAAYAREKKINLGKIAQAFALIHGEPLGVCEDLVKLVGFFDALRDDADTLLGIVDQQAEDTMKRELGANPVDGENNDQTALDMDDGREGDDR